jgi:superfamily II DNA/RNA helicase
VEKHYLSLRRCSWVVIDEADKMISENMIEDIEWLFQAMGE